MKAIAATTRAGLYTVCSLMLFLIFNTVSWAGPRVSTDKYTYSMGERIHVHFSGAPGIYGDWICIVPAGAPDTAAGDYQYLPNRANRGTLTFTAHSPGKYEVRAYYNYRLNGYVVSARHAFIVSHKWSSTTPPFHRESSRDRYLLSTDRETYSRGDLVRVNYREAPGLSSDWICIVPAGSPDTTAGDYQYMHSGVHHGHLTFRAPRSGTYEVRAYYNYRRNRYVVSARRTFTVTHNWSSKNPPFRQESSHDRFLLSTDRNTYSRGDLVRVNYREAPGLNSDWICIAPAGSPDTTAGNYQYMRNGVHHGHLTFRAPRPGIYEVRAYYNYRRNGYVVSARHRITVVHRKEHY